MSRRRPTTPAPPARRADGRDKGVFPVDRSAAVDVIDPAGHRLARFDRNLRETDPGQTCHEVMANAIFREQTDEHGAVLMLWFGCKVCRDQGGPVYSSVPYPRVLDAVTSLWERGAADDTPRRERMRTTPL